jgi:myxalamid-type polyketide synthase MxaE and MxaD
LLRLFPNAAAAPFLSELMLEAGSRGPRPQESRVPPNASCSRTQVRNAAQFWKCILQEELAQVLRMDASRIDRSMPLQSFGLDSLMALELRNRLELSLGLTLSATLVWGHPTIAALATHLASKMEIPLEPQVIERDALIQELQQLSEEDAEAALIEELNKRAARK